MLVGCLIGVLLTLTTITGYMLPEKPLDSDSIATNQRGGSSPTWSIQAIPHHQNVASSLSEQMKSLKYILESTLDPLMRKMETLETKIGRLDTSNQLRLEKLAEAINSKEIKDELALEQMTRKLDANYERLNHKLNYMENRIDSALIKMQVNVENTMNRLESHQTDMETDLSDMSQSVDEIKTLTTQLDEKHNATQKSINQLQTLMLESSASRDQVDKMAASIQQIGVSLNETAHNQNDAASIGGSQSGAAVIGADSHWSLEKLLLTVKTEIGHESHRVENKLSNMYNDLWRRFMSLETTIKMALASSNTTRRQVQDDVRTALLSLQSHTHNHAHRQRQHEPDSQEQYIEVVMDAVANMVLDLAKRVDNNFHTVISTQSMFMDTCHRLQLDEPQVETKISLILERILNVINNKTMRIDNRLVEAMELIKSQQSQVARHLGHATKMVATLTEDTDRRGKQLDAAILELAQRNEIAALSLQDLQEGIQTLSNTVTDYCPPTHNITTGFIPLPGEDSQVAKSNDTWTIDKNHNQESDPIKYIDSEEDVIKIFTEVSDVQQNRTDKPKSHANSRKFSIELPSRFYKLPVNESIATDQPANNKLVVYKLNLKHLYDLLETHTMQPTTNQTYVQAILFNSNNPDIINNDDAYQTTNSTIQINNPTQLNITSLHNIPETTIVPENTALSQNNTLQDTLESYKTRLSGLNNKTKDDSTQNKQKDTHETTYQIAHNNIKKLIEKYKNKGKLISLLPPTTEYENSGKQDDDLPTPVDQLTGNTDTKANVSDELDVDTQIRQTDATNIAASEESPAANGNPAPQLDDTSAFYDSPMKHFKNDFSNRDGGYLQHQIPPVYV